MFGSTGSGFGGFGQQNNQQQQQQQQQQPGQQQGGGLFGTPQQQQPGATGGGFGGFGAQPSTFGSANPSGGGLFGQQPQQQQQQQQPASTGFSFGSNNTSTPFGQTPQQNQRPGGFGGFGAAASTPAQPSSGFGGFGASANTQTPAFGGAATNNAFGAKPAGSGGLFGQPAQPAGGGFGQAQGGGGLFGGAGAGLGAAQTGGMPTQGTSNPPYQPFVNTEKDATGSGSTNYQYASITCLPAYRAASIEELRLQDYQQGRKTGNAGPGATGMGGFGQSTLGATGGFGSSQPAAGGGLFGQQQQQQPQQSTGFGAPAGGGLFGQNNQQQQGGGLFGASSGNQGGGLFGQQQSQPQQSGGLFGQANSNQQPQSSFTFGQPAQQTNPSSGFNFGQNNQQNKPAGSGLFGNSGGGFGGTGTSGFTFGANNNQQQQQPQQSSGFGTASSGGFSFGAQAQSNQPKPGGLFGSTTSSAPSFGGFGASSAPGQADANKPFSFGGFGTASSGAPGQGATTAPSGGLFGGGQQQPTTTSQPTSSFSFGSAAQQPATGTTGGFSFGASNQNQNNTSGFGAGAGGGLFGQQNKPATGGLFGQQNQNQQPGQGQGASGGFSFGSTAQNPAGGGGGLFGNTANKPGGLFGSSGAFGGTSQPATSGGGLFGGGSTAAPAPQAGGGLFGSSQPGQTSSLFGNSNQQNIGQAGSTLGRGLFGASGTGATGGSLFGQSQAGGQQSSLFGQSQTQQQPNLQASLTSNPYGTDGLFGGQAAAAAPTSTLASVNGNLSPQPHLPFNVARPSAKKQPPIVPPFRPSTRGPATARVAKLRGSTPSAFRDGSPVREGSPSLFASSPASNRISSPAVNGNLFRGLSDEMPRHQREASTPASLPPQAFYSRPSVKRLVLDDTTNRSSPAASRTANLFGSRASSTVRGESPAPGSASAMRSTAPLFERGNTPASARISFSPALETAASGRSASQRMSAADETVGDDTFAGNLLARRNHRSINESPSKIDGAADMSLPALNTKPMASSPPKTSKEDALLPLHYYTSPPLSELREWSHAELRAVEGFTVGRKGYGQVEFIEPVDLTTVGELSNIPGGIVQLRKKECFVYPDEDDCFELDTGKERDGVQPGFDPQRVPGGKAKQGQGLNVPAIVNLEGCWPLDRSTREPITDGEHVRVKQLVNKLKRRSDVTFKGYEPVSGTWSFRVEHFSRYGLDDDESEPDEARDDAAGAKEAKVQKDGKEAVKTKNAPGQDAEDADESIPPSRALDDANDEDIVLIDPAPQSVASRGARASSVFDAHTSSPRPSISAAHRGQRQQTEQMGSQPWAASLGLEPKRIHVMQASFFGGSDAREPEGAGSAKPVTLGKKTSGTSATPEPALLSSRSTFAKPLSSQAERQHAPAVTREAEASLLPPTLFRPQKFAKVKLDNSITSDADGVVLDAGLAMGRSFRVGWGPDGTFTQRGKTLVSSSEEHENEVKASSSTVHLNKVRIYKTADEQREAAIVVNMLETELKHASVEIDEDGCPVAYPDDNLRFRDFAASLEDNKAAAYEAAVFKLASALFDEIDLKLPDASDGERLDRSLMSELMRLRRKNNVSNWVRWYVGDTVRGEVRAQLASPAKQSDEKIIFAYLTGGFLEEACKHAIEAGDVRLATLIAQAQGGGSDDEFRLDLLDQLSVWRTGSADAFISPDYRRVVELLSGNVLLSKGNGKRDAVDRVEDVAIAGKLEWVRAFSLFLHYDQRFEAGLEESVAAYESSIGFGEGDDVVAPPLPPYLEENVKPGSKRFRDLIASGNYSRDICFVLLKLFSEPGDYAVENLAEPLSYGQEKCSYGLAFLLVMLYTKVLRRGDFSDRVDLGIDAGVLANEQLIRGNSARADNLCSSLAMQLEMLGRWTWAAFVLLHLEMQQSRRAAITALLSRNVERLIPKSKSDARVNALEAPGSGTNAADDELSDDSRFLVDTLKIPVEWIFAARADHAGWQQDRFAQYTLLLRAQHYARAHDIAVSFLAPEGIIRHDFALLLDLFAPFRHRSAAHEQEESAVLRSEIDVPGWSMGGQVYLDYIAVCRTLPHLVATHAVALSNAVDVIKAAQADAEDESIEQTFALIEDYVGPEAAAAARRIDRMAQRIPSVVQRVSELFDGPAGGRGHATTMMVARNQMVASLHNCARSLRATRTLAKLSTLLPALGVDLDVRVSTDEQIMAAQARGVAVAPPIEIESLHFMANAYCDALVSAGGA